MKKLMRTFMVMALGLSLVLSGCSKDENTVDIAGTYPVEIWVSLLEQSIEANLVVTKEGNNLKAVANIAPYGTINIILSELNSDLSPLTKDAPKGVSASGYFFKIAQQKIALTGIGEVDVKGPTEATVEFGGYHGFIVEANDNGAKTKLVNFSLQGVGEGLENLFIHVSTLNAF